MEVYVGQVMLVGFNYAPVGWAVCDGSLLPISQYDVLYSLLGTTYGGDGVTTFALPDLRGRVPVGMGQGAGLGSYILGQQGGSEQVTIIPQTYPAHSHTLTGSSATGSANSPANAVLASGQTVYVNSPTYNAQLAPNACTTAVGNSEPHENRQPFVALNWVIATQGIYPSST
jgi:microcystin-dependent protein